MVQNSYVAAGIFTSSFLSLVSTSFVQYLFFKFEQLRSFEFTLVILLLISDWLWDLTNFLMVFSYMLFRKTNFNIANHSFMCGAQGFVYIFSTNNVVIYTSCIAYTLKQSIFNQSLTKRIKQLFFVAPSIISSIIAIIPIFYQGYGASAPLGNFDCHFSDQSLKKSRNLLIYTVDLPMTIGFIFNFYSIIKIILYVRKTKMNKIIRKEILNLLAFPLIVLILWMWPSYTYTFQSLFNNFNSTGYDVMLFFLINLVGFCDSFAYCYNSVFRQLSFNNWEITMNLETSDSLEIDLQLSKKYLSKELEEPQTLSNSLS